MKKRILKPLALAFTFLGTIGVVTALGTIGVVTANSNDKPYWNAANSECTAVYWNWSCIGK